MAIKAPIIHCVVEREPNSFHKSDYSSQIKTYSVNLSIEIRADRDVDEKQQLLDEISAEALFRTLCARLENVKFYFCGVNGGVPVTDLVPVIEQVTDPMFDKTAFYEWLKVRSSSSSGPRFWTTTDLQDIDAALEASKADSFTLSRAVTAWDAPLGHRIHFTHLVRLPRSDANVAIFPYFVDPNQRPVPSVLPAPQGLSNFEYFPDPTWIPVTLQTNTFVTYNDDGPLPTDPKVIPDPDIDVNGFLVLNQEAEELSRFLDHFEAKTSSLLSANSGLQFWDDDELASLEERITIVKTEGPVFNWGAACWFAMARLTTALDPWIMALWQTGPTDQVGGPLLAPLAITLMDALDDRRTIEPSIPDFEPQQLFAAIREVLKRNCPLAGGASQTHLGAAIKHIFGLEAVRTDGNGHFVADQPPALLLSLLVDDYNGQADGTAPSQAHNFLLGLSTGVAETLTIAIAGLEQKLQDENGAEQALLRIFDTVELGGHSPFAEQLSQELNQPALSNGAYQRLLAGVQEGWENYRAMLSGPFNGAEAVRRAVAGAAARTLLDAANAKSFPQRPTVAVLQQLLDDAEYHLNRLYPTTAGCFGALKQPLVVPVPRTPSNPPAAPKFEEELKLSYKAAVERSPINSGRFIPDRFPHPLPIQIASGMEGGRLDEFAKRFNGICVSLRRLDDARSLWAYANLADLTWASPLENGAVRGALNSIMPATTDGRGTMFLNYEGAPFADRPDLAATDIRKYDVTSPFYETSPHGFDGGSQFEKLPRLAYGRTFESFSFVTTNAGTLPLALQSDLKPWMPWMPRQRMEHMWSQNELDPLGNPWGKPTTVKYDYSRRTPISQMAVEEGSQPNQPGRIGRELAGVMPLSKDYPRLGTVARENADGAIELFRDTDGVGRMVFTTKAIESPVTWSLEDIIASAPTGAVTIRVFEGPAAGPTSQGFKEFDLPAGIAGSPVNLKLQLEDIGPGNASARNAGRWLTLLFNGVPSRAHFIEAPNALGDFTERLCWVRVSVIAKPGQTTSISLVDPDGHRPGGQGIPLLLLAPAETAPWQKGHAKKVETLIRTPRVGYSDFIRWMANSQLGAVAVGTSPDQVLKAQVFGKVLAVANRMRHLDKNLSHYLDTLPDPAVEKIVLELQATDHLLGSRPAPRVAEYDVPKLSQWLAALTLPNDDTLTPKVLIDRFFAPLDRFYSFRVSLAPGLPLALTQSSANTFEVTVPTACVARFAMHALVPLRHFADSNGGFYPSVFDQGLLQHAARLMGSHAAFGAGVSFIETMYDGMDSLTKDDNLLATELAATLIAVHQVPSTRRYDLITAEKAEDNLRDHWRLIAEVDVTTQRWRATGRPIYHYIEPRKFALPETGGGRHASLPLGASGREMVALDQFEREAFFDRADVDAHTITQRLAPLPASTLLQEFPWDAPSATYFRHRFVLRSRYAGALLSKRTASTWRTQDAHLATRSNVWTMRVAMLADRSRLKLTRPQLRGLIPLTSTPVASDTRAPAPPIAAVLQEPPFSRGGLADRIASEIKTGFGYGFEKKDDGSPKFPVKVQDSRKEIGPNPQLDYTPFDHDRVLAMGLQAEGPLGLTFDQTESSTPALPNSMILLRPVTLDDGKEPPLQEALVGVSMRRYLDPAWLSGVPYENKSVATRLKFSPRDTSKCWWIEFDQAGGTISYALGTDDPVRIIEIVRQGDTLIAHAWKGPIDSGVGQADDPVEIGRFRAVQNGKPTVLHHETTPGHYLLTVLVESSSSRTEDGAQNVPITLCSMEWSPPPNPHHESQGTPVHLVVEKSGSTFTVWETMASGSTALRWTQISRDFDYVSVIDSNTGDADRSTPVSVRVDRLQASIVGKRSITFKTKGNNSAATVCRSTTGNPYPAHVHRHVAILTSSFAGELGRSIEKFGRAALSFGAKPRFPVDAKTPEHALRVIEFETPASIICANDIQAPAAYRSAYFDFIRTGYKDGEGLLLTLRFVGSRQHLNAFDKLTLELSQPGGVSAIIAQEIDRLQVPVSLYAYISAQEVRSWIVYETEPGAILTTSHQLSLNPSNVPGFHLSVTTPPQTGAEFWADVSLLHGKMTGDDGNTLDPRSMSFDFNWLFSPEAGGDPADLVSARGLSEMAEAQARIVTVSPPIPLTGAGA